MPNTGTIAATLSAPRASMAVTNTAHLSGAISMALAAPIAALTADSKALITADIAAALQAPVVTFAADNKELVLAAIAAALQAPIVATLAVTENAAGRIGMVLAAPVIAFAANNQEHVQEHVGMALRAPVSAMLTQSWHVKRSTDAPRCNSRYQRHANRDYYRYPSQLQSFLGVQCRRMNVADWRLMFDYLDQSTADQIALAETSDDLS